MWPYSASLPTLARWAPQNSENVEWPSGDPSLVRGDGHTFAIDPLTFDEFMAVCHAIDCVPTVVVCYDSMYKPPQSGGHAPSRALLLETAREWVRYANVTNGGIVAPGDYRTRRRRQYRGARQQRPSQQGQQGAGDKRHRAI